MTGQAAVLKTDPVRDHDAEPDQRRLVVIIPAYNEDRFIGSVVIKARRYTDAVIVVDDGSSDETCEVAETAGARVIRHATNQGKGTSLNTGLQAARELEADAVVFMDGDGQHDPAEIPLLTGPVFEQGADIVIGSRFLRRPNRAPLYRRLGQRVVTLLTNLTSGVPVTDSWSGFRALSRRAVSMIQFQESGWGIEPELQFQALAHGLKVVDVAVDMTYHEPAKRNPVLHATRTINGILRLVGRHRPLLLFWSIGLLSVMTGVGVGLWVVDRYIKLKALAGGIALISVTLVMLGVLTLYTALILSFIRNLFPKPPRDHA